MGNTHNLWHEINNKIIRKQIGSNILRWGYKNAITLTVKEVYHLNQQHQKMTQIHSGTSYGPWPYG